MTDLKTAIEVGLGFLAGVDLPWSFTPGRAADSDMIHCKTHQIARTFNTDSGTCRDSSYLVHCVNSWPLLAAEIERLEAEVTRLKHVVEVRTESWLHENETNIELRDMLRQNIEDRREQERKDLATAMQLERKLR